MTSGSPAGENIKRDPWPPGPWTAWSQEDTGSHPRGAVRPHSVAQVRAFASEAQADDTTWGQVASQRNQVAEVHVSTGSVGEDHGGVRVPPRGGATQGRIQVLCQERHLHCILENTAKHQNPVAVHHDCRAVIQEPSSGRQTDTAPLQTSPSWISSRENRNFKHVTATYCSEVIMTAVMLMSNTWMY